MNAVIAIEGIECYACHGCLEEESKAGGRYRVDVFIETDISTAVQTDRLEDTIDYVLINEIVRAEMAIRSRLIEHAASRILQALAARLKSVKTITVKVIKLNPPVTGYVDNTSVKISYSQ